MSLIGIRQDLTGGIRSFVQNPGFAAAALITLALGIGATSAISSVVKAVLLAPLPYAEPDRRVLIWSRWINFDKTWLSDQEIVDYRALSRTMTAVAGWGTGQQNLTGAGDPMRIGVGYVTANAFDVLGARPIAGRTFTEAEDRPNGPAAAVLGYGLWQTRFAGRRSVIGEKIWLDDVAVEVVGVMPEGFRLPTDFTVDAAEPTVLWRPLQIDPQNLTRGSHGFHAAAVLAPGQTPATASQELAAITRRLTEQGQYPEAMKFTAFAVGLDDEIRGTLRPAMRLLSGAVACLLLIACVNVANLLLARGDARRRELAVRTAVGASPGRLLRQLLTESLMLSVGGACLGLLLARVALRVLVRLDPTSLPSLAPVAVDWTVILFTLVLSVATALIFGLAPAVRSLRLSLVESLREGGQQATIGPGRQRLRRMLVAAEVSLAVMLVIGAGLMLRSLVALNRIELGFDPSHVLTMRVSLPAARYDTPARAVTFYQQLLERVRSVNGVEHAGLVRVLPLATTIGDWGLDVEGFVETPERSAKGDWQIASDGAFEALGTRRVGGRWFTSGDRTDTELVAVVNETMARTYWKDGNAIDGRIRLGNPQNPWVRVVGIVGDERHNGITGVVKEKFYIPHSQWNRVTRNVVRNVFLVARTAGEPLRSAAAIRGEIGRLDPNLPVANIRPMTDVVSTALATPRLTGFLLGSFAVIALALAAVGIYGVLSYLVSQRTNEIGIRLAIGADPRQVLRMILREGLGWSAAGIVIGVVGALALTRLMQTLLYQVQPVDPITFVLVPLALVGISIVASTLPALRATRVEAIRALRM